jgi:hypothetical protein
MSDRELLEYAAKAAGIDWDAQMDNGTIVIAAEAPIFWNPLTNDGAALRLAVKLHINIEIWDTDNLIRTNIYIKNLGHGNFQERYTTDPLAATRRAIVRAAAEIGRNMP